MFMRMIYDEKLAQAAYLLGCQRTGEAIVIDPERDVDRYIDLAAANGLQITAVTETHIHADFLSGSRELAEETGAMVYLSAEGGPDWQYGWLDKRSDGGTYPHRLLRDGDKFDIGGVSLEALHTPGHTPEHIAFLVTDRGGGVTEPIAIATGDFVFVGDMGRPDLLETAAGQSGTREPSARALYGSVGRLDDVPDFVQVWPAHGAGSACGKALGAVPLSTIGYEKRFNPAIRAAGSEAAFVDFILTGQPEPPLYFARMKRDNRRGPAVLGSIAAPAKMSAEALRGVDGRTTAIIDTRPWAAYREGHVAGSFSFPLSRSFNTDVGSMVDEETEIYLIVSVERLEEAVRDLVRIGLDQVRAWIDVAEFPAYEDRTHRLVETNEVSPRDAEALIDDPGVAVLDVRRATEFAQGHLPGALNIAHTRLAGRLDELPRGRRLIVNCQGGVRSARACGLLQRAGYDVVNLAGGYSAFARAQVTV